MNRVMLSSAVVGRHCVRPVVSRDRHVTPAVKFDKTTSSSTDDSVMSEFSVEHINIVAESASSFDEPDTSATSTKTYSTP